jgi:hypothetical protein
VTTRVDESKVSCKSAAKAVLPAAKPHKISGATLKKRPVCTSLPKKFGFHDRIISRPRVFASLLARRALIFLRRSERGANLQTKAELVVSPCGGFMVAPLA